MSITQALPTAEAILQLEPEELAAYVLSHVAGDSNQLHIRNFISDNLARHYQNDERVLHALMEAWAWLVREGLLVEKDQPGWTFISRRGKRLQAKQDFDAFRRSNVLPKASLHPTIAERVRPNFIRGEYDTSVFQAFKEVEVAVRTAGGFSATDIGTELMGKAFNVDRGPLADMGLPEAERRAMLALFSGAIGLFKNPSSHRHVSLTDPKEAAEIISFASCLMRIVDSRSAVQSGGRTRA